MKQLLIVLMLSLFSVAHAQQVIRDKDAELRQVADFEAIDVSSAIELRLSSGNENTVAVSAATAENRAGIRTEVKGRVLKIWYENKKWFKSSGKPTVYVAVKSLKRLEASGACNVIVSGELTYQDLAIQLSGASDFKGSLRGNSLNINLSGASDMTARGTNTNINIDASGASRFKGFDLVSDNCRVEASGASDVKLTVNKVLNVKASGASNIHYAGTGTISDIKTSGASNVSRKG